MGITVKEIAALANCSPTTVSKVLNNRNMNISEPTKNKILAIAAEHNYIPNVMAQSLRSQRTNTLGFVLPDITNPYYAKITRGIEDAAQKRGFSVVFSDTDNKAERVRAAANFLISRMVDGIILDQIGLPDNLDFLPKSIPVVIVDRLVHDGSESERQIGRVYSDTQDAIYHITKLHIQAGSRKLAFISSNAYETLSPFDRYYGYVRALKETGLELDEQLVHWGRYDIETGSEGVERFLQAGLEFDSVVCGNDMIAVGAMAALKDQGIRVPEDVRVSGAGDISFVKYLTPAMTTVAQFSYEMGEAAANMLIDKILEDIPLCSQKLDYQLLRRESV